MRLNWKSTLRILMLAALVVAFVQWLPAAPAPNGGAASGKLEQPDAQEQVRPSRQQPEAAQPGDEQNQVSQAENQQLELQLEQVRQQVAHEMMDRMRYGSTHANLENIIDGFLVFCGFMGAVISLLWVLRLSLDHRRWSRMVRAQTETHAKLLDKFGSSQELLSYIESDAGKRFLETPVFDAPNRRAAALPYGRILWSVQVGIIGAVLGAGVLLLRGRAMDPDTNFAFEIFGTLIGTLGIGFLVSGGVSYALAKYMGLLTPTEESRQRPALRT